MTAPVFAQSPAVIRCGSQPRITTVPVYGTAEAKWTVDTVSCDQSVSLLATEQGYAKIQYGGRTGYVEAKLVQLLPSQPEAEKRTAAPEAQPKAVQPAATPPQPAPAPPARQPVTANAPQPVRKVSSKTEKPSSPPEQRPPAMPRAVSLESSSAKTSVAGWAGYVHPLESNQNGGLAFGGSFDYKIVKPLSAEVRAWSMKRDFQGNSRGMSEGTLSTAVVQFSTFYHFDLRERWSLNLGGGAGYYFVRKFELDSKLVQSWNALGFNISEKLESAPGLHAGGSVDVRLTERFAVNFDMRYCRIASKGSWSQVDRISGETVSGSNDRVKLDMIMAGIGLKFSF